MNQTADDSILSRLRRTPGLRRLVQETSLSPRQLVAPLFVAARDDDAGPIEALPGVVRHRPEDVGALATTLVERGVGGVLLFGVPASRDAIGSEADATDGPVQRAIRVIRHAAPDLPIATDVCLCQYTATGSCDVGDATGGPDHEATLQRYAAIACSHAAAGADIVAPSGMADGQVAAIRRGLDAGGHAMTAILAYAAKFASSLYGPFRTAADSAPTGTGGRAHCQLPIGAAREARLEACQDEREGADMIMVKPAGMYLDVIASVRAQATRPVAAYQVGGEYAMLHAAASRGWLDLRPSVLESLIAIRRAGADVIITYFAADAALWLEDGP